MRILRWDEPNADGITDDAMIRAHYAKEGVVGLAERLPHRSPSAIVQRASALGVKVATRSHPASRIVTAEMVQPAVKREGAEPVKDQHCRLPMIVFPSTAEQAGRMVHAFRDELQKSEKDGNAADIRLWSSWVKYCEALIARES